MQLKLLKNKGVETLMRVYPDQEAGEIVFACLEHFAGTKRHTHIVEPQYEVSEEAVVRVMAAFDRLSAGEPLQYVTGEAYFYGRTFSVTSDTLIPRPETELLCRLALDGLSLRSPSVLDLCTGSGCIAWTLALELPRAQVTAVDISDGALAVASSQDFSEEISRTGAVAPAFIKTDVLAGPSSFADKKYDLIVSNPPYVADSEKISMDANVLEWEPSLALFVPGADPLLFYRKIGELAFEMLAEDGALYFEINQAYGMDTVNMLKALGYGQVELRKDAWGNDRMVKAIR